MSLTKREKELAKKNAKDRERRANAPRYNVFIGDARLIQDVIMISEGEEFRLEGRKAHHRWTIRKNEVTRKVKLCP